MNMIQEALPTLDSRIVIKLIMIYCNTLIQPTLCCTFISTLQIQSAVNPDILTAQFVTDTFHDVLAPAILKYQVPSAYSPLGEYFLSLAKTSSCSEVRKIVSD